MSTATAKKPAAKPAAAMREGVLFTCPACKMETPEMTCPACRIDLLRRPSSPAAAAAKVEPEEFAAPAGLFGDMAATLDGLHDRLLCIGSLAEVLAANDAESLRPVPRPLPRDHAAALLRAVRLLAAGGLSALQRVYRDPDILAREVRNLKEERGAQ